MEYAESRRLLDRLPKFEVKPGLARIERLLDRLGHPERSFPAIHVTGTNGKGSVVAMLVSVLQSAGYRVGRYTSPDVVDFRDRICVRGEWIPEVAFAEIAARLAPGFAHTDVPSQFEALTAIAFEHFRISNVDVAVVEVGLGGRYDATNVVHPILSVLTNVSLDHTALLGPTEEAIAWEKAGIAKDGVPMLAGQLSARVEAVVRGECAAVGAPLRRAGVAVRHLGRSGTLASYAVDGADFPHKVRIPLLAPYQIENLRLVLAAVDCLRDAGYAIPREAVLDGLARVSWPGRWEVVRKAPCVILDGAHNPAAAIVVATAIVDWEPNRERRRLLLGVLRDKDAARIVETLIPHFAAIGVAASASPRALEVSALGDLVDRHEVRCIRYDSVEEGVRDQVRRADPKDTILLTGSLTVVAEARRALGGG
jgi:dihydrofolate synthase/folylpolyglutamate synthase